MFNGIIYNTGKVVSLLKDKNSFYLGLQSKIRFKNKDIGSSISCNGICLTLTKIKKKNIYFYISDETIGRSNFKNLIVGDIINLEKSIIYGQKISGHFLQGHIDTIASINKIKLIDKSWVIEFKLENKKFASYLVEKASIGINGVSLTISKKIKNKFVINVIPHTLRLTNLKNLKKNNLVNIELDIFSKYIANISKND